MTVLVLIPGQPSRIGVWRTGTNDQWSERVIDGMSRGSAILQGIDALLDQNHLELRQLTHIGVMRGPASYTQLRLFISTANTLAWALDLPEFGFETKHVMPNDLPHLVIAAKRHTPIEPIYPTQIG